MGGRQNRTRRNRLSIALRRGHGCQSDPTERRNVVFAYFDGTKRHGNGRPNDHHRSNSFGRPSDPNRDVHVHERTDYDHASVRGKDVQIRTNGHRLTTDENDDDDDDDDDAVEAGDHNEGSWEINFVRQVNRNYKQLRAGLVFS